jgi:glutathione peroxidase
MDQTLNTVYEFSAPLLASLPPPLPVPHLDGQPLSLDHFRGRVLLIVNTASLCGFTPQYAGLEALYRTYRGRGFEVLAFPCNQFGAQEPDTEAAIGAFCEKNYGVTFPLFAKIDVNGPHAHPLYRFLKKERPGLLGFVGAGAIRWNFTKFLVDREGNVVARYGPAKQPRTLARAIERLLGDERPPSKAIADAGSAGPPPAANSN